MFYLSMFTFHGEGYDELLFSLYYTYSMNIHIPRHSGLVKQQLTIHQK